MNGLTLGLTNLATPLIHSASQWVDKQGEVKVNPTPPHLVLYRVLGDN